MEIQITLLEETNQGMNLCFGLSGYLPQNRSSNVNQLWCTIGRVYVFIFSNKNSCFTKPDKKRFARENALVSPTDLFATSNTLTSSPAELNRSPAQEGFALVSLRTHCGGNRIAGVQLRTEFGWQNLSYWSCNVWWKDPSLTLTDCISLSRLAAKEIKTLFAVTWAHLIRIDWDIIHTGTQSIMLRSSFCSNRAVLQRSIWVL